MLFKYSGKYVNIYFNMKITFRVLLTIPPTCLRLFAHIWLRGVALCCVPTFIA